MTTEFDKKSNYFILSVLSFFLLHSHCFTILMSYVRYVCKMSVVWNAVLFCVLG